jgi:anionic cell wall polymer biosynthesis LytR-Cps2A-Psr (LCP) family protein
MFTARLARMVAGKAGYVASCLVAVVLVVVSGYAHLTVNQLSAFGGGASIGDSASVGAMNILLMGLESRTNFVGQELDHHLQHVLNSGSVGSQDTDTLVLIHIFAGGRKAVGFSIPRDSVVSYPRTLDVGGVPISSGKIDQAYAWAYDVSEAQTASTSMTSEQRAKLANQQGQKFEVETVEALTGVKIDHFIESNLVGFYSLAAEFGGIEVCLKPAPAQGGLAAGANLTDYDPLTGSDNSGFNAYADGYNKAKGGAQYLHLSAAQSLAFVRSRDTLPGVDIGRTHRQQAAIDYVIYQLKNGNYFGDLAKISAILGNATSYLVTDPQLNLLDFATNMSALTGKNLTLTTLPGTPQNNVPEPGFPGGEDIINVNVPAIRQRVRNAFYPKPAAAKTGKAPAVKGTSGRTAPAPAPSTVTVDVYNGSGAPGLAGDVSRALGALGYRAGTVADATAQSQAVASATQVFYGAGTAANAAVIATRVGATARPLASLPAGQVEVLLGSTVSAVPVGLASAGTATAGTQSTSAQVIGGRSAGAGAVTLAPSVVAASSAAAGGGDSTTVPPNAPYGIPCVY